MANRFLLAGHGCAGTLDDWGVFTTTFCLELRRDRVCGGIQHNARVRLWFSRAVVVVLLRSNSPMDSRATFPAHVRRQLPKPREASLRPRLRQHSQLYRVCFRHGRNPLAGPAESVRAISMRTGWPDGRTTACAVRSNAHTVCSTSSLRPKHRVRLADYWAKYDTVLS